MFILRVEHTVHEFADWKAAFDSDPVGRKRAGVRRHRVLRSVADQKYVMIDLEFDTAGQAEGLLAGLRALWGRIQGTIIESPEARIVEVVETIEY